MSSFLNSLTLRQRVGQVFMVGFDALAPEPDLIDFVTRHALGGVIYFARNIQSPRQVAILTNALQEAAATYGPPLLVSTDQEGGVVARFTEHEHFAVPPAAAAYGKLGDAVAARRAAAATAEQLRAVGVNMNFAPVLDVNNNPNNPVIGVRSFSDLAVDVARLGAAQVEGYQYGLPCEGVLATGKHFPGHGNTHVDSHHALPGIDRSMNELEAVELVPFRAAVAAGCAAIMTAHIEFPAIEPQGVPATLSRNVITGLLRQRLGYTGLIVTDCMEMAAVSGRFSPGEAAVRALEAGVDMVLYSHTRDMQVEAIEAVTRAVESGRLSPKRLNDAVARILEAKRRLGLDRETGKVEPDELDARVGTPAQRALVAEHARRAVTVVEGPRPFRPWGPEKTVQLITFAGSDQLAVENARGHRAVLEAGDAGDALVQPGADEVLVVTSDAWRRPDQVAAMGRLLELQQPITHVSLRGRRDLELSRGKAVQLCVYDSLDISIAALVDVLTCE